MLTRGRFLLVCLLVVLLPFSFTACGGGGTPATPASPAPTPTPSALTYTGTEYESGLSGPVSASFTQNGTQVTGSWGNEFGGLVNLGTLTGTLSGSSLSATLTSSLTGQCSSTVTGTVSGTTITGSFVSVPGCATPQSGTFTLNSGTAPPNVAGSATGTLHDSIAGAGTITASITQNGVALTGTFSDSFGVSGQIYGVIVGSTVYFDLLPSNPANCPFSATGTLSGTNLSGNYTAIFCGVADTGTFSMTL